MLRVELTPTRGHMVRNIGGLGLVGLLLVVGVVLFLFPEPLTSGLGGTLIAAAVLLWVAQELL